MTTRLTTWMCPITLERSIYFDSLDDQRDGIDVVEDVLGPDSVEMKLIPESLPAECPVIRHGRFVLALDPDPRPLVCTPFCHYYANEPDDLISISWELFESYIIVEFKNPDHCQWIETQLIAYGPEECSSPGDCPLVFVFVDAPGGIPESKSDAHSGGGTTIYQVTQNQIVPGMRLVLTHFFWNGSNLEKFEPDFEYYGSPCLIGGKIKQVHGDYDTTEVYYTVEVLGADRIAYSSDFVDYEVGDWVFMTKTPGVTNTCRDTGRDPNSYYIPDTDYDGQWTILPIIVGDYGPVSL